MLPPSPPSPRDQRSRVRRIERLIAQDILAVDTPDLDAALEAMVEWWVEHPEATWDEVLLAFRESLDRGLVLYIEAVYGVLIEDVPAGVEAVGR